jgi:hypothetical protein
MNRFNRNVSLAVAVGCLAWIAPARAVDCTGTITKLGLQLDGNGIVTLGLSSGPGASYICAINYDLNGVAPVVCRTLYATLMAAKLAGKSVLIRFHDYSSCASIPNWTEAGQLSWTQQLLD